MPETDTAEIQANTETFLPCKPPRGLETAWTQPFMPEAPKPEALKPETPKYPVEGVEPEGLQRITQCSCSVTEGARLDPAGTAFLWSSG